MTNCTNYIHSFGHLYCKEFALSPRTSFLFDYNTHTHTNAPFAKISSHFNTFWVVRLSAVSEAVGSERAIEWVCAKLLSAGNRYAVYTNDIILFFTIRKCNQ